MMVMMMIMMMMMMMKLTQSLVTEGKFQEFSFCKQSPEKIKQNAK